jgi:hypothetical protein
LVNSHLIFLWVDWACNNFDAAVQDTLQALHLLGVELTARPTESYVDALFERVKNEILAVGFDEFLAIPRTTDPKGDLVANLLIDAGMGYLWWWWSALLTVTFKQRMLTGQATRVLLRLLV